MKFFQISAILLALSLILGCDKKTDSEPQQVQEEIINEEHNEALKSVVKLSGEVSYTLESGEQRNKENPDTFEIPERNLRENLNKGDLVKLIFTITDGKNQQTERMWVLIESVNSDSYTGILDNDPLSTDKIKSGMKVKFRAEHVISIFE